MFKTLFFILITSSIGHAAVSARWLSVTSVAFDDGKTKFLIDAPWTRPELSHWLNLKDFPSDEVLVRTIIKDNNLKDLTAVFASHYHFDHAVDVPMVAKLTGATFYVDTSGERLGKAYKDAAIKMRKFAAGEKIQVGDFVVIPLARTHTLMFDFYEFLPGDVPEDMHLGFWQYRSGRNWYFLIIHPEGTILFDGGTESHIFEVKKFVQKIDVVMQGLANRNNDEQILDGYVKVFKPKIYVPMHFDNFFKTLVPNDLGFLPFMHFERMEQKLMTNFPETKTITPKFGEIIKLF